MSFIITACRPNIRWDFIGKSAGIGDIRRHIVILHGLAYHIFYPKAKINIPWNNLPIGIKGHGKGIVVYFCRSRLFKGREYGKGIYPVINLLICGDIKFYVRNI